MGKRILVTGGAGFIGSHFIDLVLTTKPEWQVVCLDALTYAGHLENLDDAKDSERFRFVEGDITNPNHRTIAFAEPVDYIVHFAAETHVDRSIHNPSRVFLYTNILGTQMMVEDARKYQVSRYVQVSTDEVYGSLALDSPDRFTETTPLAPSSLYSASKAAGDMLALAALTTHDVPVVVVRSCNNYGPRQHPEKMIPRFVARLMANKPIPLHGDGLYVRDWIHVTDNCRAILTALESGETGHVYNIGASAERSNISMAKQVCRILGLTDSDIAHVDDRPGNDRRYAIDASKIQGLGWSPCVNLDAGLKETAKWYIAHPERRVDVGEQ